MTFYTWSHVTDGEVKSPRREATAFALLNEHDVTNHQIAF